VSQEPCAACAAKDAALRPFAEYHRERCRLHPNVSKTDSTIPVVSYGEARIGDKHFRAADAALSSAGEDRVPLGVRRALLMTWDFCTMDGMPSSERAEDVQLALKEALEEIGEKAGK